MRSLRIVVRTASGTLPFVVAASVSTATACGKSESGAETAANASGGSAGGSNGGVSNGGTGGILTGGTSGGVISIPTGGNPSTGGSGFDCDTDPSCYTMTIPIPGAGMPIEPGQVCAATVEPVESNRAALVTLEPPEAGLEALMGNVSINPSVTVLGTPSIEVLDATNPALLELQLSPLEPSAGGFTFQGSLPAPLELDATHGFERMTFRVTLEAACDGGSRQVHAVTDVHLCLIENEPAWVSSGQTAASVASSPRWRRARSSPTRHRTSLPLAHALRLRIVELARISNTIVLLAENDGGDGLDYEWLPSAGRVERLAPDVVVWTLARTTLRLLSFRLPSTGTPPLPSRRFCVQRGGMKRRTAPGGLERARRAGRRAHAVPAPQRAVLVGPIQQENLALQYLAAAARARAISREVVAYSYRSDLDAALRQHARALEPDLVGLGIAFQNNIDDYIAFLHALRERGYAGHLTCGRTRADVLPRRAAARRARPRHRRPTRRRSRRSSRCSTASGAATAAAEHRRSRLSRRRTRSSSARRARPLTTSTRSCPRAAVPSRTPSAASSWTS